MTPVVRRFAVRFFLDILRLKGLVAHFATRRHAVNLSIECEREVDGRWLAEVPELPGVMSYGSTAEDAMAKAQILALRVLAERLEHGESRPVEISITLPAAA